MIIILVNSVLTDTQCLFCWVAVVGVGRVKGLHGSGWFSCKMLEIIAFGLLDAGEVCISQPSGGKHFSSECDTRWASGERSTAECRILWDVFPDTNSGKFCILLTQRGKGLMISGFNELSLRANATLPGLSPHFSRAKLGTGNIFIIASPP